MADPVYVIIPAAGVSRRMQGAGQSAHSKLFLSLHGTPLLAYTLAAFADASRFTQIIIPTRADLIAAVQSIIPAEAPSTAVIVGGETRQQSVANALTYIDAQRKAEGRGDDNALVLVHDGARCLVSRVLIERCLSEASRTGAVTAAVRQSDSLKRSLAGTTQVAESIGRDELWSIQTPQVFQLSLLLQAHAHATPGATDDAALVEPLHPVTLVEGEHENIKVTVPSDLRLAESLLALRAPLPLDQLALQYGTDKSSQFHNFAAIYEQHFSPRRHAVRKVLEIGILKGASLRMWHDYFPHATIFGVDNDPHAFQCSEGRFRTAIGDQTDDTFWARFLSDNGGDFDIIIDDGGHTMEQQRTTFSVLYPQVKPGGIYVIEDLHTSYWDFCGGGYRKPGTMIEFLKDLIDDLTMRGKCDCGDPKRAQAAVLERFPNGLNFMEQTLGSIHIYKSIAFLYRRET